MSAMWAWISPILRKYLPVAGRYAATAAVGLLAASLNKLNIPLPPDVTAELTAGLGAVFVGLLGFALNHTAKQEAAIATAVAGGDPEAANLANAVKLSAASGQEVATESSDGKIHFITARQAPDGLAAAAGPGH